MRKLLIKQILSYEQFFGLKPPKNRMELIQNIPKESLILKIAGLNYRLKPKDRLKIDMTLESQAANLEYFCSLNKDLFESYFKIFKANTYPKGNYPIIFNRYACLFALEEIINCDDAYFSNETSINENEVRLSVLNYLLCVNTEIVKVKPIEQTSIDLEKVSASSLVLNELQIEDNPLFTVNRGMRLIDFLSNNKLISQLIHDYFNNFLNTTRDDFFYGILSALYANVNNNPYNDFVYTITNGNSFLDLTSQRIEEKKETNRLLSIKKSPFYKLSKDNYILLDHSFLINKAYFSFINDFWFDWVKGDRSKTKDIIEIERYKGLIGDFSHIYVCEILARYFHFLKHPKPLFLNELKINLSKGNCEVADFYIRKNKSVLVGQIKSGSIYDAEKFSGEIKALYKKNREKFFEDFGVNQLISSIQNVLEHYGSFDPKLPVDKCLVFYPVLVAFDKVFQTPLFSNLIKIRFDELVDKLSIEPFIINSVVVMHVSDIELLEYSISTKKIDIFDLIKKHQKKDEILLPFNHATDSIVQTNIFNLETFDPVKKLVNKMTYQNESMSMSEES